MKTAIEIVEQLTQMTDEEVAKILGVSRQTVISYKNGTSHIPSDKLVKLSRQTGISLDIMFGNEMTYCSPQIRETYSKVVQRIVAALNVGKEDLENLQRQYFEETFSKVVEDKKRILEDLVNVLHFAGLQSKKPLVGFMGLSDVGKSTTINYLLGDTIVPASYGPLTSVTTYYMSNDERPKYLDNPLENAIVLGRKEGSGMKPFVHNMLDDEEITCRYLLKKGDADSILKAYGTREGAFFSDNTIVLDEIVIFLDNPILKEVMIVDFPGFHTGTEKDDISLTMDASQFDCLFFLSRANGFFSTEEEISSLAHILQGRKNVDSIYILATHANTIGDPNKLNDILTGGCERLVKTLSNDTCARLGITEKNFGLLRSRFFGFSPQVDLYCQQLNANIEVIFPRIIFEKVCRAEKDFLKAVKGYAGKMSISLKNLDKIYCDTPPLDKDKVNQTLASIDARYADLKREMKDEVAECCKKSKEEFKQKYHEIICEQYILDAIQRKEFQNRNKDLKALGNYLSQELNEAYATIRYKYSEKFADKLTQHLDRYQKAWLEGEVTISMADFDFSRAFVSGLTGFTTFGALAVWASVVAAGSNLGAYILIAKLVSILSAVGINLGGTAAVVSWVAAIGGPITLGIAFAVIAAVAAFGIISGTWKPRVAKKFIKEFEKNDTLQKCLDGYDMYWQETDIALEKALEAMHTQAKKDYSQRVDEQQMDSHHRIALKTILSMLYQQAEKAYARMAETIETTYCAITEKN